jgi:Arc/MetJ-type ribon-helix-helix transcriptional regulator
MGKNLKSTTLSVNIPVEIAQALYQQVRDGKFTSDDEVVRAALRHFLKIGEQPENPSTDDAPPTKRGRRNG